MSHDSTCAGGWFSGPLVLDLIIIKVWSVCSNADSELVSPEQSIARVAVVGGSGLIVIWSNSVRGESDVAVERRVWAPTHTGCE